jgi:F0F1-type ATP synthase assembly protein I
MLVGEKGYRVETAFVFGILVGIFLVGCLLERIEA